MRQPQSLQHSAAGDNATDSFPKLQLSFSIQDAPAIGVRNRYRHCPPSGALAFVLSRFDLCLCCV
jgi:hypothetical protein